MSSVIQEHRLLIVEFKTSHL